MTDMNNLIRSGFGRADISPEPAVARWTRELEEAIHDQDLDREAFCKSRLHEAQTAPTTSFSAGVHQPVPQRQTPAEQMNDLLRRRRDGR